MFKNILKKISGIDKLELEALSKLKEAKQLAEDAKKTLLDEQKLLKESRKKLSDDKKSQQESLLSPKEKATKSGKPWIEVISTHVSPENIRHGFFELDWNDIFIKELIKAGYGLDNDNPEDIVDRWFREQVHQEYKQMGESSEYRTFGLVRTDLNKMK